MTEPIEGFHVPLHQALTQPILLGGAPRNLAILIGTFAAALGLGLHQWLAGLIVWLAGHSLAVVVARKDPHIVQVLARHLRQKGYWRC
ncbi:MAG TPA: VirB3 family type IV secretion system protein [Asticcacaulis sp.]|nr:VirB3 family type IV secretion system protein [Asticcacaulis sp.]